MESVGLKSGFSISEFQYNWFFEVLIRIVKFLNILEKN